MTVCILGVAVAVALLVVVTGISLGLANSTTVESEDIDYWIVPDEAGSGSVPLEAEGARLSQVHEVTADLRRDDRIDYASPVVLQPLQLRNPATGDQEYVIAVGVIPTEEQRRIADMEISSLDTAYSYYDDGTYDGEWSGQFVASPSVAERLTLSPGETVTVSNDDRSLTLTEINDREMAAGFGEVPAIAMPLAELQSLTGLDRADQADQILVSTTDPAVETELAGIYPQTDVVSRAGISGVDATPTNLPLAMALAATLVAGGIGVAFVATMMGLELTAGRRELAVLSAVGFSGRARALVVVSETVTVAVLGGILGVGLGALATVGVNAGVASAIGIPSLATITPVLIGYALVAAVAVGVCAAPYPLYLTSRTNTLEELTR
ncbi:FtsX-like permease family protein [Halorubrum kocurii]|uniref:FtsX-like permease family protein n=1 Tax=Halorubrum kocurii TaxID=478441 RepID=UPI0009B5B22B|nr:FtsX-like permease family protein [Halorubrum kocurii]